MMNILVTGLPCFIKIRQKDCAIDADCRTALKIITAFEDKELTATEKNLLLVELLYIDTPDDYNEALEKGVKFLDCGECNENSKEGDTERIYSFKKDAKYIYSGVDRVLNGKLSKGDFVHWWEFVMAFMELPEDCMMSKIIYYRTQFNKNRLSKDERRIYNENRDIFELPVELTAEETEQYEKFMRNLGNFS